MKIHLLVRIAFNILQLCKTYAYYSSSWFTNVLVFSCVFSFTDGSNIINIYISNVPDDEAWVELAKPLFGTCQGLNHLLTPDLDVLVLSSIDLSRKKYKKTQTDGRALSAWHVIRGVRFDQWLHQDGLEDWKPSVPPKALRPV